MEFSDGSLILFESEQMLGSAFLPSLRRTLLQICCGWRSQSKTIFVLPDSHVGGDSQKTAQFHSVQLAADFTNWEPSIDLTWSEKDRCWIAFATVEPGIHSYKFVINSHRWVYDSFLPHKHDNHGNLNNVLSVHGTHTALFSVETSTIKQIVSYVPSHLFMELYFGTHSKTIELSYSETTSSFETLVSLSPGRFVYRFRTGEGHLFFDTTLLPMKSCDGHLGNSFVIEDSDDDDNWRNWNWNVSDSFWESSPTNAIRTAAMCGSDEGRDSCSAISFECLDESTPPSGTPPRPSWGFISARRNPHQTPPFQSFSTAIRTISSVRSHHFDPSVCPHFCNLQKETKTPHQLRNSPSPYHSPTPLPSVSPIPPVSPVWGSFHSHVTQTPINLPSLLQNTFTSPLYSDQLDTMNSEDESDFSLSSSSSESQHSSCASSSTLCSPSCHSIPISFSLPSSLLQPCSLYDPFNLASEFSNPARDLPQTVVHTSSALASLSSTFSSVPTPLHRQTISTQIVPHPTPPHRINISAFSSPPSLPVPSSLPPPLIAPCITHPSDDDSVTDRSTDTRALATEASSFESHLFHQNEMPPLIPTQPSLASYARLSRNYQHSSSLLSTSVLSSSLSVCSSPHSPQDGWEDSGEWSDLREMRWRQEQKACSMERKALEKGKDSKRGRTSKTKERRKRPQHSLPKHPKIPTACETQFYQPPLSQPPNNWPDKLSVFSSSFLPSIPSVNSHLHSPTTPPSLYIANHTPASKPFVQKSCSPTRKNSTLSSIALVWQAEPTCSVFLAGSFSEWQPIPFVYSPHSSQHFIKLRLPRGKHHIKFVQNGEWMCCGWLPTEQDHHGNINNMGNVITEIPQITDPDYQHFKDEIPTFRVVQRISNPLVWEYNASGNESDPVLLCLPSLLGTPDIFYKQFNELASHGIRIISALPPAFKTMDEFVRGLDDFLNDLKIRSCHLLGAGLGGFEALSYAKVHANRVSSIILVNSFGDNSLYYKSPLDYKLTSSEALRSSLLENVPLNEKDSGKLEANIFIHNRLDTLNGQTLVSRFDLQTQPHHLVHPVFDQDKITIITTFDCSKTTNTQSQLLKQNYPKAHIVDLKDGGEFPYLSRSLEFNMHAQVHMRRFASNIQPAIPSKPEPDPTPKEEPQHETQKPTSPVPVEEPEQQNQQTEPDTPKETTTEDIDEKPKSEQTEEESLEKSTDAVPQASQNAGDSLIEGEEDE
ncbi:putative Maspardin [Blattamonas nauphoetae]|uniref:Maspardin n=1 Tax=Blattamonas nauphoetae TaxID=2049346 RepID=A0ABQ9XRS0_9EUKA|nr:putative Maspardin [Blattamonas nauphoetae]